VRQVNHPNQPNPGGARFRRVFARDSTTMALLQGCPVVTAEGAELGTVESLLIERKTRQLRYVVLTCKTGENGNSAAVAIPWQALYFDSATSCLVFYTYS
jgi:sporulation protein YlmC with PRC-barrel domain